MILTPTDIIELEAEIANLRAANESLKSHLDASRKGNVQKMEVIEQLRADNEQLKMALKGIWDMADEDIREGAEGDFTAQIEADARHALKETGEAQP